jgi:hypothetical protein
MPAAVRIFSFLCWTAYGTGSAATAPRAAKVLLLITTPMVRVTPSANLIGQIYPPFDHVRSNECRYHGGQELCRGLPGQRNGERTTDSAHAQEKPVLRSNPMLKISNGSLFHREADTQFPRVGVKPLG